MIVRTWTEQTKDGTYRADKVTLLLNLRHAEYDFPSQKDVDEEWYTFEDPEDHTTWPEKAKPISDLPKSTELPEEWKDGWEVFVMVSGDMWRISNSFKSFAGSVSPFLDPMDYTPGGDDDFFDYWPGAMECLREWATDMDQLYASKGSIYSDMNHMRVYHNVVIDFLTREFIRAQKRGDKVWVGEIVENFVNELASDWKCRVDHIIHYISDLGTARMRSPELQSATS